MNKTHMKSQSAIRAAFWRENPSVACKRGPSGAPLPQNSQPCDTRAAFVEYIDALARAGEISERLAQQVTL